MPDRSTNRLTEADVAEVELSARRIAAADAQVADADELLTAALRRTANFRVTRLDLRPAEIADLTHRCGTILETAGINRMLAADAAQRTAAGQVINLTGGGA